LAGTLDHELRRPLGPTPRVFFVMDLISTTVRRCLQSARCISRSLDTAFENLGGHQEAFHVRRLRARTLATTPADPPTNKISVDLLVVIHEPRAGQLVVVLRLCSPIPSDAARERPGGLPASWHEVGTMGPRDLPKRGLDGASRRGGSG
jgi:hypothetical protein